MSTRVISQVIDLKSPQEAVSKYIEKIDESGIQIHPEVWDKDLSTYVQIDGTGLEIHNGNSILSKYGVETIIGNQNNYHIEITPGTPDDSNDPAMLRFVTGKGTVVAYMSGEELNIPRVVVLDSMKVGKWIWDGKSNDSHLTLRWIGATGGNE